MDAEQDTVANAFLEHLTPTDLALLAARLEAGSDPVPLLRERPDRLEELLGGDRLYEAIFATSGDGEPLLHASPFLVFSVCVHRAAKELQSLTYVSEWLGPGRRAPLFDVEQLRAFVSAPRRRFFLAELLASYTHVSSGSVVRFTRRGLRRQRFSELDPVRLAGLLDVVAIEERPGVLRRLGDLALFLTSVFPDYTARRGFGPVELARLVRSGTTGARANGADRPRVELEDVDPVGLLEHLGRRWYKAAFNLLPRPIPANLVVVGELPQGFPQARRVLSLVTERFVFSNRNRWFGLPEG
jgi:hypothetical protein